MTTPYQSPCVPLDAKPTPIQGLIGCKEWHFFTRMVYLSSWQQTMTAQIWNVVSPPNLVTIYLAAVYRPLQTSVLKFGEDLADYTEKNINLTGQLVLTGNFNIHINDKSNSDSIIFHDILDLFGLTDCRTWWT